MAARTAGALTLLTLVLLAEAPATGQSGTADWTRSKSGVVMLRARLDGARVFGAGLVVGAAGQDIYVATADHLVRRQASLATDVQVQVLRRPGEWLAATLLDLRDRDLDLAVVRVTLPAGVKPTDVAGAGAARAASLAFGTDVYAIGYPSELAWGMPASADKVASAGAIRVSFQSAFIQPGSSGGGLFDACGRLRAMVREVNPPMAEAVRIETVVDALHAWAVPVTLKLGSGECGSVSSRSPEPTDVPEEPAPTPTTGSRPRDGGRGPITLRYTGDWYACGLQIKVTVGDTTVIPTGNVFQMQNVALGSATYEIAGQITCPSVGMCVASGSGSLDVQANAIYDVMWRNTTYAVCQVWLVRSP